MYLNCCGTLEERDLTSRLQGVEMFRRGDGICVGTQMMVEMEHHLDPCYLIWQSPATRDNEN